MTRIRSSVESELYDATQGLFVYIKENNTAPQKPMGQMAKS